MYHSEVVHHDAVRPLAWIPTKGNDIPPHAVPLHGAPNGQLYIARGLLGGEMHVGTTSYSSSEGAQLRDRYGRSRAVFEYEVLTCASTLRFQLESPQSLTPAAGAVGTTPRLPVRSDSVSATRTPTPVSLYSQPATAPKETGGKERQNDPPPRMESPTGGWVEVPKQPRPTSPNPRENVQFKYLAQSKCFTLIDDTPSMQSSWSQTRAALTGIINILSSDDKWDGLNVRFLHHAEARPCIKTREEFECVFNSVTTWGGDKAMAAKVAEVFEEGLPLIYEASTPRPVVLLIVTDGIATDTQELFDAMIRFCHKLNEKSIPAHMFRIHILQMGDDRKAIKPLHDFRDRMTQRDRSRRMLNVVSFHRGRGLLNAENITKLLLASTHIPLEEDPDIGERLPPEVIEGQYRELERMRVMGNR
ncbi:hypothetical protein J3R82DRAFT_8413 [Butyriboletus roseoflavus]|nr:hypothetical protein J3R82DRAFT_8413 [Butyriboletus roseoflavus]